jgi:RNA polymerase sigma factor (sigma-70 family)
MNDAESDEGLFERYRTAGDRAALAALFERHIGTVAGICARMLSTVLAEEAAQETFIQAIRTAHGFKRGGSFKYWLIGIAIHSCRGAARREKQLMAREDVFRKKVPSGQASTPADDAAREELIEALNSSLQHFPVEQRSALVLHFGHSMSHAEIAAIVARPKSTVASWLDRGLEQLRSSMRAKGHIGFEEMLPLLLVAAPPAAALQAARSHALHAAATAKTIPAIAMKGAFLMKIGLPAALLLLVLFLTIQPRIRSADASVQRTDVQGAAAPLPDPIFDQAITVQFRRAYLSEILTEIQRRTGVRGAFPLDSRTIWPPRRGVMEQNVALDLELTQQPLKTALEGIARAGGFELRLYGKTPVFWKHADDKILNELARQLVSPDLQTRCLAVGELDKLGDPRIYPLLFSALNEKDAAVTALALDALRDHLRTFRYAGNTAAVLDSLRKLLDEKTAGAIIPELIGATQDSRAVETLESRLAKMTPEFRRFAAAGLFLSDDPKAIPVLLSLLDDGHPDVRMAAAFFLGEAGDAGAVQPLLAKLSDSKDVAREAAVALGKLRASDAIKPLAEQLPRLGKRLRYDYAAALAAIDTVESIDALKPAGNDDFPVLAALGKSHRAEAMASINALMLRGDASGQTHGMDVARQISAPGVLAVVRNRLDDPNRSVRMSAARLLAQIGDSSVAAKLESRIRVLSAEAKLFGAPDARFANASEELEFLAEALGELRTPAASQALLKLVQDPDEHLQFPAAMGLSRCRDKSATDALIKLFRSNDLKVREAAVLALADIGEVSGNGAMIELLSRSLLPIEASNLDANAFAELGDPHRIYPDRYWATPECHLFLKVADALVKLDTPVGRAAVHKLLSNSTALVRLFAIYSLGQKTSPADLPYLLPLLHDPSGVVRRAAADVLNRTRDPRGVAGIARALASDPAVSTPPTQRTLMRLTNSSDTSLTMLKDCDESARCSFESSLDNFRDTDYLGNFLCMVHEYPYVTFAYSNHTWSRVDRFVTQKFTSVLQWQEDSERVKRSGFLRGWRHKYSLVYAADLPQLEQEDPTDQSSPAKPPAPPVGDF